MTISLRQVATSLIFVFTIALFVFFVLFDTYTWGKYAFLALSICIFLLGCGVNHGKFTLWITPYVTLNIMFVGFALFSALWAINASDSIIMARTLIRIFVCAYIVYITYLNIPELDSTLLIKAVMWAGYFVALYSLYFYGLNRMMAAGSSSNLRVENEFSNINTIGMTCALSCVIQINLKCLRPKDHIFPFALLMIPSVIVIAATQSRKALFFLTIGALGYAFVKTQKSKKGILIKIIKILFGVLILTFMLYWMLQLDAFEGIRERMEGMLHAALGKGKVDSSTLKRNHLKALGLKWFLKYPLCGIGIANPHILAKQYLAFDAYLHDNFVELLCGGGIIGFCLYYSMYVYLFMQLWKYRKIDPQRVTFFTIWLGLMLAMDYGMVSYYSKADNFYLMIHFLNVFQLKQKAILENGG